VRLTTSSPSCAECHEIWEPKPPGTLWVTPDLLRDCFILPFRINIFPAHNPTAGMLQVGKKEVCARRTSTVDDQPGKLEALSTSLKHSPKIYLKLLTSMLLGYTTAS